jgi:hypothetical protein
MPISFLLDSALGQLTAAFILPFAAPRSSGHRHSPRRAAPVTAIRRVAQLRPPPRSTPPLDAAYGAANPWLSCQFSIIDPPHNSGLSHRLMLKCQ